MCSGIVFFFIGIEMMMKSTKQVGQVIDHLSLGSYKSTTQEKIKGIILYYIDVFSSVSGLLHIKLQSGVLTLFFFSYPFSPVTTVFASKWQFLKDWQTFRIPLDVSDIDMELLIHDVDIQ